jgi:hypothetical protein
MLILVEYFGCSGSKNSTVGLATCCRVDGLEFKPGWGRASLYPYTLVQRHTQAPVKVVTGALSHG